MKHQTKTIEISTSPSGPDLTTAVKVSVNPTEEQIRQRARALHMVRMARGENGHPLIDWLQAENELRAEMRRQQLDAGEVPQRFP